MAKPKYLSEADRKAARQAQWREAQARHRQKIKAEKEAQGIKPRKPGRPKKYESEEERKAASRASQRKYKETKKARQTYEQAKAKEEKARQNYEYTQTSTMEDAYNADKDGWNSLPGSNIAYLIDYFDYYEDPLTMIYTTVKNQGLDGIAATVSAMIGFVGIAVYQYYYEEAQRARESAETILETIQQLPLDFFYK